MSVFILSLVLIAFAFIWYGVNRKIFKLQFGSLIGHAALAVGLFLQGTSHFVMPKGDEIVLLDRVYLGSELKDGRLIATDGERGLQARTLPPGFQFYPFVNVAYKTQIVPYTIIPEGQYGLVSARDGQSLPEGSVMAPPVPAELFLDAQGFMNGKEINGVVYKGTKGPQTTILRPGAYPINLHLFSVETGTHNTQATVVPNGTVAVIKSAVNEGRRPADMPTNPGALVDCSITEQQTVGSVKVELVPVGCRGTWEEALPPGTYFLNYRAYDVTKLETRTNVWEYAGGYQTSIIDLKIDASGAVTQEKRTVTVPQREGAAGSAVAVKVEGWTVYVDVRVQAQASPGQAPATVAAVGDLDAVRVKFITPDLRSAMRNIGGGFIEVLNKAAYDEAIKNLNTLEAKLELLRSASAIEEEADSEATATEIERLVAEIDEAKSSLPDPNQTVVRPTRVLDFIENRDILEKLVARAMKRAGEDAGVSIVGVKIGNVDIPAELLVAAKREDLAKQFRAATIQERLAQVERIETERERATADQQSVLVAEQIARDRAAIAVERRTDEGRAEEAYLRGVAAGEKARAGVLGEDRVVMIKLAELLLNTVQETPELITGMNLPQTVVMGGGDGLAGAASVLGATKFFGGPATAKENTAR